MAIPFGLNQLKIGVSATAAEDVITAGRRLFKFNSSLVEKPIAPKLQNDTKQYDLTHTRPFFAKSGELANRTPDLVHAKHALYQLS